MSSEPGPESGFLPVEQYNIRRSHTLIDNPQAKLDETIESARYLETFSPHYIQELRNISDSIGPMSERCRLSIGIPALTEGLNISKTLEFYTKQKDSRGHPIDPDLFEIVVFDNHSGVIPKDSTQAEVEKFQQNYPEIHIAYVHKQWEPGEPATAANARKHLADLALLRSSQRKQHPGGDLILGYNDADAEEINDVYVDSIINAFDNRPTADALTGKSVLSDVACQKPNVLAAAHFWGLMSTIVEGGGVGKVRFQEPAGMVGRNMAMRASIYAAVGGFNPRETCADDLEMGWLIADARDWNPESVIFLNKARIVTSPRRHLAAIASGGTVFNMYLDFHTHPEIRNMDNNQLLENIPNQLNIDQLESEVDAWWQARDTGEYKYLGDSFEPIFRRAMNFLNVDYEITEGHVRITGADRLLAGLSARLKREVTALPRQQKVRETGPDNTGEEKQYHSGIVITELRAKKAQEYKARIDAVTMGREIRSGDTENLEFLRKQYLRLGGDKT